MIHVEQYKLFHNSKDFEIIYKAARNEFLTSSIEYIKSIEKYLKNCIQKESILLLYDSNVVIGFYIIYVENRKVKLSFSFIHPKHRGNKYNLILLEAAFSKFKCEYDVFIAFIHYKNIPSLKSLYFCINKFKFNYFKDDIINEKGQKFYKFTIEGF